MTIAWASLLPSDIEPALRAVATRGRGARAWWLARASAAWPEPWRTAWHGALPPTLVIWPTDAGCEAALLRRDGGADAVPMPDDRSPAGLAAWRRRHGGKAEARLGLGLDRALFFERSFKLPEAALPRLDAILDQEVACRTPFDRDEIWHAAEVRPASPGLRSIHHWILRRDHALGRIAALGLAISDFDTILLREPDGRLRPVIPLDGDRRPEAARGGNLARLALLAALCTLASLVVADLWEGARAARVAETLAMVQGPAASRTGANRSLQALMAVKSMPDLGSVWAELSRILPDDTFLTEMRLDNGSLTIRGLSANAAALVRVVSASPLFATAALTAGITPNAKEGRDAFSLSADLRGAKVRKPHVMPIPTAGFPS